MQGSKRSDKISGCPSGISCKTNVTEWYKSLGCATAVNQVTDVVDFTVKPGEIVTLTLRGFSSYLNTLYFNGFTRSVTVNAPCLACGGDPCTDVDVPALIDSLILKLEAHAPGDNPDNIYLTQFYQFQRIGDDQSALLRITGKPLTVMDNLVTLLHSLGSMTDSISELSSSLVLLQLLTSLLMILVTELLLQ